jgi:hypothetical protein
MPWVTTFDRDLPNVLTLSNSVRLRGRALSRPQCTPARSTRWSTSRELPKPPPTLRRHQLWTRRPRPYEGIAGGSMIDEGGIIQISLVIEFELIR